MFWDDWMLYWDGLERDREHLARWFTDTGKPQLYLFHRALLSLPGFVAGYRALAFAGLLLCPVLYWCCLRETQLFSRGQSLRTALLAGTLPALVVPHALILLPYLVCVALFLAGAWLLLRTAGADRARLGDPRLALAFALFLASFTISSLDAFYLGVWGAWVAHGARRRGRRVAEELAAGRAAYATALALPFVAFAAERLLFPPSGGSPGYNPIRLTPSALADLAQSLVAAFALPAARVASAVAEAPVAAALTAALAVGAVAAAARARPARGAEIARPAVPVVAFALVWLVLATLPYALVGKTPAGSLWDSRHALLVPFPVALLLSEGIAALARIGAGPALRAAVAALLVASFATAQLRGQLAWLARSAKDADLVCALRELPAPAFSVYWVRDRTGLGPGERYTNFEWSSLLRSAWGGRERLGLSAGGFGERQLRMLRRKIARGQRTMLRDVDLAGAHATLDVYPAAGTGGVRDAWDLLAAAARGPDGSCPSAVSVRVALAAAPAEVAARWRVLLERTARISAPER